MGPPSSGRERPDSASGVLKRYDRVAAYAARGLTRMAISSPASIAARSKS